MKTFKITKKQIIKAERKALREIELELNGGWKATRKVHKSNKDYSRKYNPYLEMSF